MTASTWPRRWTIGRTPPPDAPPAGAASARRAVLPIEILPKWLLCVPLVAQWLLLSLRHRSVTLPSVLDPDIETGGLAGESKYDCLARIGPEHAALVSPTLRCDPGDAAAVRHAADAIGFPLIAKPDIGWCGHGVRRIADAAALTAYVAAFPADAAFLLQRLETAPHEAGLAYRRAPGEDRGRLVAITLRHRPAVTGDGRRTVGALLDDAIARGAVDRRRGPAWRAGLGADRLAQVPAAGEPAWLTTVASLRIGARYEDATAQATPVLADTLDRIARSMGRFHYGRFDVRFASLAALRAGRFAIIEVNGAGSEAIEFWDPRLPMRRAFAGVFRKQADLFRMAATLRRAGARPVGLPALARAWRRQQSLIRRYPRSN